MLFEKSDYQGPLVLEPGHKAKLHYHYQLEQMQSEDVQLVHIQLTMEWDGKIETIDRFLERSEDRDITASNGYGGVH